MTMFLESKVSLSFDQALEKISNNITLAGWKLLYTHDLQAIMHKNGIEVSAVKVLEICKPTLSAQILTKDNTRQASALMPCRISIFEREGGSVFISRMNVPLMQSMLSPDIAVVMKQAFEESEEIIKDVITQNS